jgi:hypothetical protein
MKDTLPWRTRSRTWRATIVTERQAQKRTDQGSPGCRKSAAIGLNVVVTHEPAATDNTKV